ncbi:MAG: hypothetical protein NTY38_25075 [Acidobacteria bacterium]|nr:hypothetical protein [Acidobacteriota bacterium]
MKYCALFSLFFLSAIGLGAADTSVRVPSATGSLAPELILDRYFLATAGQQERLRGVKMEVDIQAQLPKLKKQGRLHGFRHISKLGRVTYDALRFVGDKTIQNDVIARYLTGEKQAEEQDPKAMAISQLNYKFKYKGLTLRDGKQVYVFELKPRKKRVGLFKGELLLDPESYLPVREMGQFVKNPSVFLKKIEFTRDYVIRDGLAIPKHVESTIETRIVGKAQISIDFFNFSKSGDEPAALPVSGDAQ